jgi:ankyrin repeat protein
MNLFDAVKRNDADAMRAALAAETDVDRMEENGRTALMVASAYGRKTSVEMLLAAGANVNHAPNGITPLMWASAQGNAYAAKMLLAAGADVDHATRIGETALMYASSAGHADVVHHALLAAGANVDKSNYCRETALLEASKRGHAAVVEMLLAAGADVNQADVHGRTAMFWARKDDHAHVVALLYAANGIRARHLLKKWQTACRVWRMTRAWWMSACERSYAPGGAGYKRSYDAFRAVVATARHPS